MNVMILNWIILPGICRPLSNNYKALLQQPEVLKYARYYSASLIITMVKEDYGQVATLI